jgi:cytochrome P450
MGCYATAFGYLTALHAGFRPDLQPGPSMSMRVDFTSQEYFRDPSAGIARIRAFGSVVEVKFPIIGRVWIVATHALAERMLKDSDTFALRRNGAVAGLRWWMPRSIRALANSMLTVDEPDHTRLRQIVDEAFRRRAIVDMEPHIQAIADELARELFAEASPADVVERFARRLPLAVICELLGLPDADRAKFMAWTSRVSRVAGPLGFLRLLFSLSPM